MKDFLLVAGLLAAPFTTSVQQYRGAAISEAERSEIIPADRSSLAIAIARFAIRPRIF